MPNKKTVIIRPYNECDYSPVFVIRLLPEQIRRIAAIRESFGELRARFGGLNEVIVPWPEEHLMVCEENDVIHEIGEKNGKKLRESDRLVIDAIDCSELEECISPSKEEMIVSETGVSWRFESQEANYESFEVSFADLGA